MEGEGGRGSFARIQIVVKQALGNDNVSMKSSQMYPKNMDINSNNLLGQWSSQRF